MRNWIIGLILICCLSDNCVAQKVYQYQKGKIIKSSGDTINCLVPISIYYEDELNYKIDKNSPEITIKIKDIKFLETPFNIFENISSNKNNRLMRIVVKGEITLYSYVIPDESSNPNGGLYLYSAPDIYYTIKKSDLYYEVKKRNFKVLLSEQLKDCNDLVLKIKNKVYKFDDLEKIINEYNSCKK